MENKLCPHCLEEFNEENKGRDKGMLRLQESTTDHCASRPSTKDESKGKDGRYPAENGLNMA